MKKLVLAILFVLLLLPAISAIEISLSKDSYNPQETLQVEITGSFISLNLENILIYEQDKVHPTPVISDLIKQGDIYYFYAVLPNIENNFSLKIEDAQYTESGQTKTDTITQNFKIVSTNESVLQINPGFIRTSNDFSITLKSLNNNQDVSAELKLTGQIQQVSIIQDVEKTISFVVSEQESTQTNIEVAGYSIPVFIVQETEQEPQENQSTEPEENQSEQDGPKINVSDLTEEEIQVLSCSDFGEKCESNEKCDGEKKNSLDGPCCVGQCVEEKQSNSKLWIGIGIIVVILLIIGFLYLKTKKIKLKSTEDILKDKSEKYKSRMKGDEVTRSLGRV